MTVTTFLTGTVTAQLPSAILTEDLPSWRSSSGVRIGELPTPATPVKPSSASDSPATPATLPKTTAPTPVSTTPPGTFLPIITPAACGVTGCDVGGCNPVCGPPGQCWVDFEWLYWIASGQKVPAGVTTAPPGTPLGAVGAIGAPGTATLFGNQRVNNDFRNGFRGSGGFWFNEEQTFGIEGNFFFIGQSNQQYATGSDGTQILTRPFFNVLTGTADSELVSYPGVLAGRVTVDPKSSLIGGGVNFVHNLCCDPCLGRVDLLYGYRFFNVTDEITYREDLVALPGSSVPAGTTYAITDRFKTRNDFNGGLIGLSAERRFDSWFVGVRGSVALGNNRETTEINGTTTITPPGGLPQTYAGGLLAQPSNIGTYHHDAFAVLPEFSFRMGYQLTDYARIFVGYNFIYLSNVARAGDQVDLRVNPNQLPPPAPGGLAGPAYPVFQLRTTDFWVQGVSAGFEWRF